jgi:hypothetical protein
VYRYDYIKRMIEALGAALARIAGLRSEGRTAEALAEVRKAYATLELNPELVASLGGKALVRLLGTAEQTRGLAALLKEESEINRLMGNSRVAETKRRQALTLMLSLSTDIDADQAAQDAALVAALVDPETSTQPDSTEPEAK